MEGLDIFLVGALATVIMQNIIFIAYASMVEVMRRCGATRFTRLMSHRVKTEGRKP